MHVQPRDGTKPPQAKDVPELPILLFLLQRAANGERWATWYRGQENSVPAPADCPEKVLRAKMLALIRRGLVDGCPCGCRGDYRITAKGRNLFLEVHLVPSA